ncbi:MAG: hypothetical protein NTZ61_15210 [Proteobacteria bacterium]|nr:hypothetical protein [Pseudomonadota bacterium]
MKAELEKTQSELGATRAQLDATRAALEKLADKVDRIESGASTTASAAPSGARIAPVNADNPAISFVVDTEFSTGNLDPGYNFSLQSAELFISAPIDPFLRGYASVNGTSEEGFGIEEAALVTTSLPWNLTVKGGRFMADVGRMPRWHNEQLPFTNRPESIERIFGGETISEGAEVTWLAPIDHYVRVTTGLYNTIGAENSDALFNNGFDGRRSFNELTWLVHPSTYFDLSDTLNLEIGGTYFTVNHDSARNLFGADVTLRHQPGTSGFYQGFVLGSEWYWNSERFEAIEQGLDPDTGQTILGSQRFHRNGGYAYLEAFLGRRYSVGVRGDYAEDIAGPADRQRTLSAFATWLPSEFQRLRLQADAISQNGSNGGDGYQITLQWTGFLGSHSHGFAAR